MTHKFHFYIELESYSYMSYVKLNNHSREEEEEN